VARGGRGGQEEEQYHEHDTQSSVWLARVSLRPEIPDTVISFPQLYSTTMLPVCDIKIYSCDRFSPILQCRSQTTEIILAKYEKCILSPPFSGPVRATTTRRTLRGSSWSVMLLCTSADVHSSITAAFGPASVRPCPLHGAQRRWIGGHASAGRAGPAHARDQRLPWGPHPRWDSWLQQSRQRRHSGTPPKQSVPPLANRRAPRPSTVGVSRGASAGMRARPTQRLCAGGLPRSATVWLVV